MPDLAAVSQRRRLFPEGPPSGTVELIDSVTTSTGVVMATYRAAGRPSGE